MFSAIRKRLHLTPSMVIASLALVFAMSGGAYAASKYVITSTTQISPKVLKSLTGKAGANGAQGAAGAAGPSGSVGGAGAKGENGAPGASGTKGETGPQGAPGQAGETGETGPEGSPWTAGGTLPSGATETGTYYVGSEAGTGTFEGFAVDNISFSIPLSKALAGDHVIYVHGSVPSECENSEHPGTASAENPEASRGYLCVYYLNSFGMNQTELEILSPVIGSKGASVTGALLLDEPTGTGAFADGTWAVTAP
jgi:hypothetical protein